MHKNCEEAGEGKPRMVTQLIESRKATLAVLGFIVATRAGQRAQRQEQKMRRQERKMDETWGLNVDRLEWDDNGDAE